MKCCGRGSSSLVDAISRTWVLACVCVGGGGGGYLNHKYVVNREDPYLERIRTST